MKTIGGTDFFETVRGAKVAATRRGLKNARIVDTCEGYALLASGEGASDKSYKILNKGCVMLFQNGTTWYKN